MKESQEVDPKGGGLGRKGRKLTLKREKLLQHPVVAGFGRAEMGSLKTAGNIHAVEGLGFSL